MLVSPKMENGKQVINPEDGDTIDEVYAVVDCNIIKKDGKIRFNVVKTAVDSKKELIQETMNLVGGEADAPDLIVHLVNVLNTLLPEDEQDHDDSDNVLLALYELAGCKLTQERRGYGFVELRKVEFVQRFLVWKSCCLQPPAVLVCLTGFMLCFHQLQQKLR